MPSAQTAFDFGPLASPASPATRPVRHAQVLETSTVASTLASHARPAHVPEKLAREDAASGAVPTRTTHAIGSPPRLRMVEPPVAPPLEPADPKALLEAVLRRALNMPVRLSLTDNRRTMISVRRGKLESEVRLHHMFLQADELTRSALLAYLRNSDRAASLHLGRFIEGHRERIKQRVRRAPQLSTSSVHHDLVAIHTEVNARYFDGQVDARITWGREGKSPRGPRRSSIKLGSYCARDRLIRVHPGLDADFVPRFFVEYIVYHEMLHHVLPPKMRAGRRELHGREFQLRERMFPRYQEALRWERENLDRLLRA